MDCERLENDALAALWLYCRKWKPPWILSAIDSKVLLLQINLFPLFICVWFAAVVLVANVVKTRGQGWIDRGVDINMLLCL